MQLNVPNIDMLWSLNEVTSGIDPFCSFRLFLQILLNSDSCMIEISEPGSRHPTILNLFINVGKNTFLSESWSRDAVPLLGRESWHAVAEI